MPPLTPKSTAVVQYRLHSASLYSPAYCAEMLTYFTSAVATEMQTWEESYEEEQGVKGPVKRVKGAVRAITGALPTFERFANSIGVSTSTLRAWAEKHDDFGYAYERCKEVQKDFLMQGGLNGRMNPQAMIFVAKNITDMKDDNTLTVQAAPSTERPVLADKTSAELQALRELAEKCERLGFKLMLQEADAPEGAAAEYAEGMGAAQASQGEAE